MSFTEILSGFGYGLDVDWWAVGVTAFQLLSGQTPFNSVGDKCYEQVVLSEPPNMTKIEHHEDHQHISNIISGLLTKNSEERLGTRILFLSVTDY